MVVRSDEEDSAASRAGWRRADAEHHPAVAAPPRAHSTTRASATASTALGHRNMKMQPGLAASLRETVGASWKQGSTCTARCRQLT